jgi:hypothetical protein
MRKRNKIAMRKNLALSGTSTRSWPESANSRHGVPASRRRKTMSMPVLWESEPS